MTIFPGSIYGSMGRLGVGKQTSATPWWLSGGIAADNCVAAYQPKGAASYAASKINLASPGINNLIDGANYPTWNSTDGWMGDGTQYLRCTALPTGDQTYSAFIRISNIILVDLKVMFGVYNSGEGGLYIQSNSTTKNFLTGTKALSKAERNTSGVYGIAGKTAYYNGAGAGDIATGTGSDPTVDMLIFALRRGTPQQIITAHIQAFAMYNATISAAQVAALTAAMAAL